MCSFSYVIFLYFSRKKEKGKKHGRHKRGRKGAKEEEISEPENCTDTGRGRRSARRKANKRWGTGTRLTHWPLGKFEWDFLYVIFIQILVIDGWGISCEIALIGVSLDFTDDQSILVQVMAWCCQATSHCLSQCLPRLLLPLSVWHH